MFKLESLRCLGFKRLDVPEPIEFPDGLLLIQGVNESGKSTLMEAVHYALYGLPLRPNKRASNEDIINYNSRRSVVELKFRVDDDRYTVKRTLRLKGNNLHELVIERSNGERDRVTGYTNVNATIIRELHGIDSDALLNSCMVEQKELGKLESASRTDRIKAVTSLLNLEAFVEAEQELNRTRIDMERTNQETKLNLQQSEQAKNLFDQATEKREKAQIRIKDIQREAEKVKVRIEELERVISIIENIKEIETEVKARNNILEGRQRELNQVKKSLDEVTEAEKRIAELKEKLPKAREELEEAKRKHQTLEQLLNLENQLDNTKKDSERSFERIRDYKNKVDEAEKAQARLVSIEKEIRDIEPAREANEILPSIDETVQRISTLNSERERLEDKKQDIRIKLDELKNAKEEIDNFEKREQSLLEEKSHISRRRNIGVGIAVSGLLAFVASFVNTLIGIAGVPLILLGAFLYVKSSPSKFDHQLLQVRRDRERLLGDINRIEEFNSEMEKNNQRLSENESQLIESNEFFKKSVEELPSKPQVYSELYTQETYPRQFLRVLTKAVQKDLQSLAGLAAEKGEILKISGEVVERKKNLQIAEKLHEGRLKEIRNIEASKKALEEKENISLDEEKEISSMRDTCQRGVQEMEIQMETAEEKVKQKGSLETEYLEVKESMENLESQIQKKSEEKLELQKKITYKLEDEAELRGERDRARDAFTGLETEKKEREADVREAQELMESNRTLKEAYPGLFQQNEEEVFEIDSMRKGAKLLEMTRDGIVSGVKTYVERYMMQFLPPLTNDRYNIAKIDETNYRIQIYDREGRRWREKGVFSGATQDQFSLALRLAFALSTIPSTRGARPGFIFLDEPLSGFDIPRRRGFLLLMQKELPKYFDQIIVISHIEQLREEFLNHIQLEAGQVVN